MHKHPIKDSITFIQQYYGRYLPEIRVKNNRGIVCISYDGWFYSNLPRLIKALTLIPPAHYINIYKYVK